MLPLRDIQAAIIDMDGVLWEGERPLPGLTAFVDRLRARGMPFILATNNAARTPEQYIKKLAGMGVAVSRDEVLTSAIGAGLYLRQRYPNGARVFAIGGLGLRQAVIQQGFVLCALYETNAEVVVCGMDPDLSWDKLATATLNIRAGALFVGTNPDKTFPTERGLTHGNGAILAALSAATNVEPIIIGKPEPTLYQQALARLGASADATVAIGDRLDTDILGAVRAGLPSILVLSGVSQRTDLPGLDYAPTWVMQDIREITAQLA